MDGFNFPTNGSGSPDSQATPEAVTKLLAEMRKTAAGEAYFDAFPVLGVDGSLATIGKEPPDLVIVPAFGHVYAKTGTTVAKDALKAQVFAGYIDGKNGSRLAYVVYVNNVSPIAGVGDVIKVFADEGKSRRFSTTGTKAGGFTPGLGKTSPFMRKTPVSPAKSLV